ncbi:hypothetical protein GIB67_034543, partial [Kingdonia uniflora]
MNLEVSLTSRVNLMKNKKELVHMVMIMVMVMVKHNIGALRGENPSLISIFKVMPIKMCFIILGLVVCFCCVIDMFLMLFYEMGLCCIF